jgi:hypothetical protein
MQNAYVAIGTLLDGQTVKLDEPLPLATTRVRVVVEPLAPSQPASYREVLAAIRERQRQRGHQPPTREEVDAALRAERESWDE